MWLECPNCHRRTRNTGGFKYAEEISEMEAKKEAIALWNKGELYVKHSSN